MDLSINAKEFSLNEEELNSVVTLAAGRVLAENDRDVATTSTCSAASELSTSVHGTDSDTATEPYSPYSPGSFLPDLQSEEEIEGNDLRNETDNGKEL